MRVIKQIRAALDARYPDRMLLAEANQWPEETAPYFGDGDECQMAFHFPLMPRMYMAIAQEDRHPITDIMRQTPEIPEGCQWAIFLRNHDELTLEMVTDTERDYLWSFYAAERRARINLGIRRRLAPLLENDRRKIELMNSLLFSMPGTPVLYYGDEIGMGDNIYLGDRDGVRTPMQWSPDRNGGFSRADPARLFLPAIQDPIYGFDAVNVEAQLQKPGESPQLDAPDDRDPPQPPGARARQLALPLPRKPQGPGLCARPMKARPSCASRTSRGRRRRCSSIFPTSRVGCRIEMTGGADFPPIGELPYLLTLPAYGFYWFELASAPEEARFGPTPAPELFTLVLTGALDTLLKGRERTAFEKTIAPRFIARRRWFGDKEKAITAIRVLDVATLKNRAGQDAFLLPRVAVEFPGDERQLYFVPLAVEEGREDEALMPYAVARVRRGRPMGLMYGAASSPEFGIALVDAMKRGAEAPSGDGVIRFQATRALDPEIELDPADVRRLGAEQSNTSIAFGSRMILKLYRRLQTGIHPELEVARFLTETAGFQNTPALLGVAEHVANDGTPTALAVLQQFVRNQGDAWRFTLEALKRELDTLLLLPESEAPRVEEAFAAYLPYARVIGRRTAELHRAFATPTDDPAFAVEPLTLADVRAVAQDARAWAERAFAAVSRLAAAATASARAAIEELTRPARGRPGAHRFARRRARRRRQDAHPRRLPSRPGADRRRRRDDRRLRGRAVAPGRRAARQGLAAARRRRHAALLRLCEPTPSRARWRSASARRRRALPPPRHRGSAPSRPPSSTPMRKPQGSPARVEDGATRERLLRLHLLAKALYEIDYEANNRPDWIETPIRGVLSILGAGAPDGE